MSFSANYKCRAFMITVQEKNFENLEIEDYAEPELLAKTLTAIWENSSKKEDRTCAVAVCRSANNLYHAHIAAYSENSTTIGKVAKIFGKAHTEPQLGGKAQLTNYILKEEPYQEKGEEVLYSMGIENIQDRQGKRTDLAIIHDMIVAGNTPQQILDFNVNFWRMKKIIMDMFVSYRATTAPLEKNVSYEYHFGLSGSGKSYINIQLCKEYGREKVYFMTDTANGGLDRYLLNGAPEHLIIDDLKPGDVSFKMLLTMLDIYGNAQTHSRYENALNLWNYLYITTVYEPEKLYEEMVSSELRKTESFTQFIRRIKTIVYHYKEDGKYKTFRMAANEYTTFFDLLQRKHMADVVKKLISIPPSMHELEQSAEQHYYMMLEQEEQLDEQNELEEEFQYEIFTIGCDYI